VRPRRSRQRLLGLTALALAASLAACSDSGTPSAPGSAKPAGPAAAKPAAPAVSPVAAAPPFVYEARGRRDPFRPLITPRVETAKSRPKTGLAALDLKELKLAGIVWERRGFYALVEAPNGAGYVVRVNDTVGEDARVAKITPEAVTFEVKSNLPVPTNTPARTVEIRIRKEE